MNKDWQRKETCAISERETCTERMAAKETNSYLQIHCSVFCEF